MKRFLFGLAALPFLAGAALAGQPAPLTNAQMDQVTAGFDFTELEIQNTGWVGVGVNAGAPAPTTGSAPYIVVTNFWYDPSKLGNQGAIAQQTAAGFGP
jgi:hypothetical protein